MAKDKVSKSRPHDMAKSSPGDAAPAASLNRAQAEFQRYVTRMQTQQPARAPAFMMPMAMPAGQDAMPGWAVPPSVAMLPFGGGSPGFSPAMPSEGATGDGSLTRRLGSTIRLGVDVVNLLLAGGVRLLGGMSDAAYGYGGQEHGHSCCGCDCCGHDCCGYDCCGCECCRPSVGTCC
jgi:hypothetical protein